MANHLHAVLRTRPDIAKRWSREEVARRWLTVTHLAKRLTGGLPEIDPRRITALAKDKKKITRLRRRLSNVSWLFGTLCENIARRANKEDECKGRFFETRFQCRELASESAILVCGMYVDLNQIRAGEAKTPETSRHTSACERIEGRRQRRRGTRRTADGWLCELTVGASRAGQFRSHTGRRASDWGLLSIELDDYLRLLDWTGRQVARGKRGAISTDLAPILERLRVREESWLEAMADVAERFSTVVGTAGQLAAAASRLGQQWLKGAGAATQFFV